MHFKGSLFRALNPPWAVQPLSGEGAKRFGGRFNVKGQAALYCSLSPVGALREANQAGAFQLVTLAAYEADLKPIFDACREDLLTGRKLTRPDLARSEWREIMRGGGIAPTQQFALDLIEDGYHGMLVPSFAPHADQECVSIAQRYLAGSSRLGTSHAYLSHPTV